MEKHQHDKAVNRRHGQRTDVFTKEKRSQVMSRISGKDTKPELVVRRLLHKMGYRFRLHRNDLPGRPDIVLPRYTTAVFVHGCFWHLHECHEGRLPKSRLDFWQPKLEGNRRRDAVVVRLLEDQGWKVITIWECEVEHDLDGVQDKIRRIIKND